MEETTWAQLQNLFRQRYSKLGNTCEQLFHAWRFFTFDENTETIDSYVIRIRQVANLLGYGEPQILEVFKNLRGNSRQNSRERYRNERYGNNNNRDRNRSRERAFVGNYRRDRSSGSERSRSGSRTSTNRDRIRCYACREYDHFARNCPNSREERDLEQLQHILNMEEQDHRSFSTHRSDEDCRVL